jgi:hypothetical protein
MEYALIGVAICTVLCDVAICIIAWVYIRSVQVVSAHVFRSIDASRLAVSDITGAATEMATEYRKAVDSLITHVITELKESRDRELAMANVAAFEMTKFAREGAPPRPIPPEEIVEL